MDTFLASNGKMLGMIFGRRSVLRIRNGTPYGGFIENIRTLYGDDISTDKISRSMRVMVNATKYQWHAAMNVQAPDGSMWKCCPFCELPRREDSAKHLILDCPAVGRPDAMQWNDCTDFRENIVFLEQLQLRIDEL